MKKLILIPALIAAAGFAAPAVASADQPPLAECWGTGYDWSATYKVKPRRCTLNGDEAHYAQTPLIKIRWRSWGSQTACGTGTYVYNMGYRRRVQFCLYRPRWGVYTRVRGRMSRHYSYLDSRGVRVYRTGKATRFDARA
jgi:hypothetical protein